MLRWFNSHQAIVTHNYGGSEADLKEIFLEAKRGDRFLDEKENQTPGVLECTSDSSDWTMYKQDRI